MACILFMERISNISMRSSIIAAPSRITAAILRVTHYRQLTSKAESFPHSNYHRPPRLIPRPDRDCAYRDMHIRRHPGTDNISGSARRLCGLRRAIWAVDSAKESQQPSPARRGFDGSVASKATVNKNATLDNVITDSRTRFIGFTHFANLVSPEGGVPPSPKGKLTE